MLQANAGISLFNKSLPYTSTYFKITIYFSSHHTSYNLRYMQQR